jgi:uncharacterized damage-inducible protein DinB
MRRALLIGAVLLTVVPASALAQAPAAMPDVYTKAAKAQFDMIKVNLSKTAAKVPEEQYAFKPTPEVRTMGELIGHVADANFGICSIAAGEKPPQGGFEKGHGSKAVLTKAIDDSIAYCDGVIAKLNDQSGREIVKFFGSDSPKLGVVNFNIQHCNEHYGNLVTYMRLNKIVPPSTAGSGD